MQGCADEKAKIDMHAASYCICRATQKVEGLFGGPVVVWMLSDVGAMSVAGFIRFRAGLAKNAAF